ncbi:hypothetical protein AAG906_012876 [Vitis piasezkii]
MYIMPSLHGELNEEVYMQMPLVLRNPGQGILLRSDCDLKLYAYCDSNWASSEYRSMATTTCELKWLKGLLSTLGVMYSDPMHLYYDSQRTKHIEVDCHFMRDEIQNGAIHTKYVHTSMHFRHFYKALGKAV